MEIEIILANRCQCRLCGDIIESLLPHHMVKCQCGSIATDGGRSYIRRWAKNDLNDIIDLSDLYTMEA